MRYPYVLLDLDGTLLDTAGGIMASIKDTLRVMKLPTPSAAELRSFVGPPIRDSFQRVCRLNDADATAAQDHFRTVYPQKFLFDAEEYPGMKELLASLKAAGVHLGVATNKPTWYAVPLLEHFGMSPRFEVMLGSDEVLTNKTMVVDACLARMGFSKGEKAVLIGDTIHDQHGAQKSGIDFLAVTYGYGFEAGASCAACGAVAVCADAREIGSFLLG